jgi:hypothetical protein
LLGWIRGIRIESHQLYKRSLEIIEPLLTDRLGPLLLKFQHGRSMAVDLRLY